MITAIVLAGGLGTRLRSMVYDVPKPMAPINGRPFLAYQLDYWIEQGVDKFVFSVGYKHDIIVDFFGNNYRGVQLEYVIEKSPIGTGGGLLLAAEKINSDTSFLLLNGDTYFNVNLKNLIEFSDKNNTDWCISLFKTANQSNRYMGIDVSVDGRIQSFQSERNGTHHTWVNGGVYWVRKRALLDYTSPITNISLENTLLPYFMTLNHRLFALESQGTFIDIGLPEDYIRSGSLLV